ncbi:MAG: cell division protein ZapD [Pseudomonadota bacterium]
MSTVTIFEQPLNERIRTFMRVEELYNRCMYYIEQENSWDSHFALSTLIELIGLTARGDLKRELIKEVKRQLTSLEQLSNIPTLDKTKLGKLISELTDLINDLDVQKGQILGHLKENEFINSIKQRATIPGGTCDFDLPAYHYWLTQPINQRKEVIKTWLEPFNLIHATVSQCLDLVRDSAEIESFIATNGFYQRNLDPNQPNQLIRVLIEKEHQCFPEISAGKHRFSIRLLTQTDPNKPPKQIEKDIPFKLACCAF